MVLRWLQRLIRGSGESLVFLALIGALVHGICLLAFGCGKSSVHRRPILVPPELQWRTDIRLEKVTLTCALAETLQKEVELEKRVLDERVADRLADHPSLYIIGTEYLALLGLEQHLTKWIQTNDCDGLA